MPSLLRLVRLAAVLLLPQVPAAQVRWSIDPVPLVRIATTADEGSPRMGAISWATRLPDGRIAVVDGADYQVRLLEASGRPLRSFGREGRGPNEFRVIGWASTCGTDSVYVWDAALARMSVIHADSGFVREWTNLGVRGPLATMCSTRREFAFPVRITRNAESKPVINSITPAGLPFRLWSDTFDVQLVGPGGESGRSINRSLFRESISATPGPGQVASMPRLLGGVNTELAFAGSEVVLAYAATGLVRIVGESGERSFRMSGMSGPVRPEDREAVLNDYVRQIPARSRATMGSVARAVAASTGDRLPAFAGLFVSPDTLLHFVVSPPGDPMTRFAVHRVDGRPVATFAVPVRIAVFEVGRDYVLGRAEDDDGEETLVLYRLTRP